MKPKNILLLALLTLTGCVSNNQNISNNEFGQSDNTNSTQSSISSSEEPYIFENPITDFALEVEIDV